MQVSQKHQSYWLFVGNMGIESPNNVFPYIPFQEPISSRNGRPHDLSHVGAGRGGPSVSFKKPDILNIDDNTSTDIK